MNLIFSKKKWQSRKEHRILLEAYKSTDKPSPVTDYSVPLDPTVNTISTSKGRTPMVNLQYELVANCTPM